MCNMLGHAPYTATRRTRSRFVSDRIKRRGQNVTEKYKAAYLQWKLYHAHVIVPPSALYELDFNISMT